MEETFTISVIHNNQIKEFEAKFKLFGHTHRITVPVDETIIIFEPDEERNYRAVLPLGEINSKVDSHLLQAIAVQFKEIFK